MVNSAERFFLGVLYVGAAAMLVAWCQGCGGDVFTMAPEGEGGYGDEAGAADGDVRDGGGEGCTGPDFCATAADGGGADGRRSDDAAMGVDAGPGDAPRSNYCCAVAANGGDGFCTDADPWGYLIPGMAVYLDCRPPHTPEPGNACVRPGAGEGGADLHGTVVLCP